MLHARIALGLLGLIGSGTVMAHTGTHSGGGWAAGLAHPFMGLDHLLAMVAVGVWAMQLGGRSVLCLPAIFISTMAAGAVGGAYGIAIPQVESVVALSVLALGMAVALSIKARWEIAAGTVALFAVFHGHAHGAEMPAFAAPWLYFFGFAVATAALHALGAAAALASRARPGFIRAGGAAIGVAGTGLLLVAIA